MSGAELPVAIVAGNNISKLPPSLYVPPAALRIALANFEGPLDFLHYLIRREDMDICDIPMAELTKQYLRYVDEVLEQQLELASDYLLMSATLIEIKSRMLMPKPALQDQEEQDPRAELVQRLIIYARIRAAALYLLKSPMAGRDHFGITLPLPSRVIIKPKISSKMLQLAILGIKDRQASAESFAVSSETITVREAMASIFVCLQNASSWLFSRLLAGKKRATGLQAATYFLGVLQMAMEQIIRIRQSSDDDFKDHVAQHERVVQLEDKHVANIVEMGLLVAQSPCTAKKLKNLFDVAEKVTVSQIEQTLHSLASQSSDKAWEIIRTASGWHARTKQEHMQRVQRFLVTSPPRLSRPLMEVLAIVAYNQPATRGEIEAIRGVSTSANQLSSLEELGWVEVSGHKETPGRPLLYITSAKLLDDLGLKNIKELPSLEGFEIENLSLAGNNNASEKIKPTIP